MKLSYGFLAGAGLLLIAGAVLLAYGVSSVWLFSKVLYGIGVVLFIFDR